MKSLSVVVMPTHMLPARAAPMAPGTMTAYFDQIEVSCDVFSGGSVGWEIASCQSVEAVLFVLCHPWLRWRLRTHGMLICILVHTRTQLAELRCWIW